MSEAQTIQWFPGHMTKTRRKIQASLKLVDAVAEIIDARIPVSSRNPELHKIIENKPRIILMNKCDMADPSQTARWVSYYQKEGVLAIPVDCKSGRGLNQFIPKVRELLKDRIIQWEQKGMVNRTIRVMIVGIPNVGKSSFINRMAKQNRAKVEDRPGAVSYTHLIATLDGGAALYAILSVRLGEKKASFWASFFSFVILVPLAALGFWILLRNPYQFSLLFISVYLMGVLVLQKTDYL